MKELIRKNWNYTLYHNIEKNEYLRSVLCGGVAMYELKIILNEEEIMNFENNGEEYIDDLAKKVQKNTSLFLERKIE